jgi:hypothetical protein
MPNNSPPSPSESGEVLSLLEKLVDTRILVLTLCLLFYIDIWLLKSGLNPTLITIENLSDKIRLVPIFTVILFIVSFSILMAGVFPILRQFIGLLRLSFSNDISDTVSRSVTHKRLSDWSLALVSLSLYDAALGFFTQNEYDGLSFYLGNIISAEGFEAAIFRLSALLFWLVCFALAIKVDNP